MLIANFANLLQEAGRRGVEAAFTQYWLKNDGGSVFGVGVGFQRHLQAANRFVFADAVVGHRVGRAEYGAGHRAEIGLVGRDLAVHGHGVEGTAMVAAIETDDIRATGSGAGDLHRVFQRFGTRVGQHHLGVTTYRDDVAQLLGDFNVALVGHNRLAGVHHLIQLGFHSGHDFGVTMPHVQDADTAREVDEAVAVGVPDLSVFGAVRKGGGGACSARRDVFLL